MAIRSSRGCRQRRDLPAETFLLEHHSVYGVPAHHVEAAEADFAVDGQDVAVVGHADPVRRRVATLLNRSWHAADDSPLTLRARGLQVQERLTTLVADWLDEHL